VSERSSLISRLAADFKTRAAYINAKVTTLVPSQIRALRLRSETPRQPDLARAAGMHQSRISMLETAGANPTLGTLSEIASALKVGLKVQFVPFSEMLDWENSYSQDRFQVTTLENDVAFLNPVHAMRTTSTVPRLAANSSGTARVSSIVQGLVCSYGLEYELNTLCADLSLDNLIAPSSPKAVIKGWYVNTSVFKDASFPLTSGYPAKSTFPDEMLVRRNAFSTTTEDSYSA